ncbi:hypothetical protein HPSA20_0016 [Helicobacter pylori SouthAfrica20]|uniref:Uncharacterized protein n=1 Tax=Helicobacter pylori SouthAfrica20 TaxID=1352356 RepID=T1U7C7_HELPX|nr:hypothetical protein HPSA20_0016 [Helicobacter pylori SouthAfrica20]
MLFNTIFHNSPLLGGLFISQNRSFLKNAQTKTSIKIKILSLAFH